MTHNFRRLSRRYVGLRKNRVASVDNLLEEREPRAAGRARSQTVDVLDLVSFNNCNALPRRIAWAETTNNWNDSNKLTEDWMKDWQIPLVFPFSALEFKHRVEAVKSALMIEMDAESARDMRNYSLARRRDATCKEMLSPQIEKAACTLGILGL
ncbi:hypothetical protein ACROYT_G043167 [Oculina patagonica]